ARHPWRRDAKSNGTAGRTPMDGQRRLAGLVGAGGAALLLTCLVGTAAKRGDAQTAMFAYVGALPTAQRKARRCGIHVYRGDPPAGAWTHVQHVGDLVNPSFLALSPDRRFLYSVHGDGDYATAFALEPASGETKLINRGATGGKNGVRQAVDPSG